MASSSETQHLPWQTKLFYGAGDFGFSLTETILGILFGIFLTDVAGLRPSLAALAIFIGRSWDYVNDPLMGYLSDRTRTRWGRRRPYLLFGALPYGLCYVALWWRPPFQSQTALAIYYALAYILYDATATAAYMPYYALTPELTSNYDERTTLTSYRMAFSLVGGFIGFAVPMLTMPLMRPQSAGQFLRVIFLVAAVSALPLYLTFLGTRERPELQAMPRSSIGQSLRAAMSNRPFIFAIGMFLTTQMALGIVRGTMLYFLKYRFVMSTSAQQLAGAVFAIAIVTLPLWNLISRRWDKRTAFVAGMLMLAVVLIAISGIDPDWGIASILALAILAGFGFGALNVLPWAMIPDVIEWDELQTGQRHEGVFYSLVLLLRKVANSLALPGTLLLLDRSGYISGAAEQPASAMRAIQMLMGPIPAILLFSGITFALFYPLRREQYGEVIAQLVARRVSSEPSEESQTDTPIWREGS